MNSLLLILGLIAIILYPTFLIYSVISRTNKVFKQIAEEKRAKDTSPVELKSTWFDLKHPANWNVKVEEDDENPDPTVVLRYGNTSMHISIFQLDASPSDLIKHMSGDYQKRMDEPKVCEFFQYGVYPGIGITFNGVLLHLRNQEKDRTVTCKLFALQEGDLCGILELNYFDDEFEKAAEGLQLIESTFKIRPATVPG
ncbi:hypothetical protein [Gimesia sp.]|uniref:hypothetical protein n=1 Tax=Gimesia sp. TaxID=2024833 RepID=UPI003A9202CF